jgi:hypothetical protein
MCGGWSARKRRLFLKKKKQKDFCPFEFGGAGAFGVKWVKVFCFFFSKKKRLLSSLSARPVAPPVQARTMRATPGANDRRLPCAAIVDRVVRQAGRRLFLVAVMVEHWGADRPRMGDVAAALAVLGGMAGERMGGRLGQAVLPRVGRRVLHDAGGVGGWVRSV